jgi:hypothetical protein
MTSIGQLAPTSPNVRDCTYNLFWNKRRPDLFCAVPDDHPIPPFLQADEWAFNGSLHPFDAAPVGFSEKAADAGVRFNGYYLFQTVTLPEDGFVPCVWAA